MSAMSKVLEPAGVLRAALAAFEPALLSGDDCVVVAEALARTEKACAVAGARAALRAGDVGAHRRRGFSSPGDWLARTSGITSGAARGVLDTAGELERCPATKAAAVAGDLSLDQAGIIARTEGSCPGSEAELVALAGRTGLRGLRDEATRRRVGTIPPEELHLRQHRARSLRHWRDDLGMVRLAGALPPEVGVGLVNRLDAEADRIRRAARAAGSEEPFEAHAADALVRLASGNGKGRANRADVVVVVDLHGYRRGHTHDGEVSHVVGGGPLPVSVVRELAEDAFVKAVVHDGVKIDTVAHLGRHIPAELRTALELGQLPGLDGVRCDEPGCDRRYGLQWDHTDPVANGGPTSYGNLTGKCTPHHWEKTERDREAGLLGPAAKRRGPPATASRPPPPAAA